MVKPRTEFRLLRQVQGDEKVRGWRAHLRGALLAYWQEQKSHLSRLTAGQRPRGYPNQAATTLKPGAGRGGKYTDKADSSRLALSSLRTRLTDA